MRAFGDPDLIQADSGSSSLIPSISATIPGVTTEGNCGLIMLAESLNISPPADWDIVVGAGSAGNPQLAIIGRSSIPAGESSWAFATSNGASGNWCWRAEEWGNVAFALTQSTSSVAFQSAPTSLSSGSTGTFDTEYVFGVAAVMIQTSGGSAWPTVSWSNGFATVDTLAVGTG